MNTIMDYDKVLVLGAGLSPPPHPPPPHTKLRARVHTHTHTHTHNRCTHPHTHTHTGKLLEYDSPQALLANPNSEFAQLVAETQKIKRNRSRGFNSEML